MGTKQWCGWVNLEAALRSVHERPLQSQLQIPGQVQTLHQAYLFVAMIGMEGESWQMQPVQESGWLSVNMTVAVQTLIVES